MVEEKEWKLTPKFQKSYCALYVDSKPIFGVNFYGAPRFAVWIKKKEAERLSNHCEFERYYDQHRKAVYPLGTSVGELLPIFEFVYPQPSKSVPSEVDWIAKAKREFLDKGMTQEEIDQLFTGINP